VVEPPVVSPVLDVVPPVDWSFVDELLVMLREVLVEAPVREVDVVVPVREAVVPVEAELFVIDP
jgi:CxxC motif-containing protein